MGTVLRGRAPDGSDVAIKVLRPNVVWERFDRERRLLADLGEAAGFVPYLESGRDPSAGTFLVMPLIAGGTLRDRLRRSGTLGPAETIALGRSLAAALGRAHALGIVHRDVKPENVLFASDGRPLLADLGIAKHFRHDSPGASLSTDLSKTGEVRGTPGYMALEQFSDAKSVEPPADVFALGAMLYECLAGHVPFEGNTALEMMVRIQDRRVENLASVRADVPAWLATAIGRALAPAPEERFADGAAFDRALAGPPPTAARTGRGRVIAAILLAAGLGVAVALGARGPGAGAPAGTVKPPPPPPAPPGAPATRFPEECASFLASRRTQLVGVFGGYAWHTASEIAGVAFLPGKKLALTGEESGDLTTWDLATGKAVRRLQHFDVKAIAVTPDGRFALSGSASRSVRFWDLTTGAMLAELGPHPAVVTSVAITPDAKLALVSGEWPSVFVWDLATRQRLNDLDEHRPGGISSVAISPDGEHALSGGDEVVTLWALTRDHEAWVNVIKFVGHTAPILSVAFSPDGKRIASGSMDHSLRLWDPRTGRQLQCYDHPGRVERLAFRPDGALASGCDDGIVRVFRPDIDQPIAELACGEQAGGLAFSADGKRLLVGDRCGVLGVHEVGAPPPAPLPGHLGPVLSVAPAGSLVASGSRDHTIRLWRVADGASIARIADHLGPVNALAVSKDGASLLSGSSDTSLQVHQLPTGTLVRTLTGHLSSVWAVALATDGRHAFSGSGDYQVGFWDLGAPDPISLYTGHSDSVNAVALSADGRYGLSGSTDGTVRFWDMRLGRELACFKEKEGRVAAVAMLPDARTGLSGTPKGELRVWDLERSRLVQTTAVHAREIRAIALAPDGKRVLTSAGDRKIVLTDLATGAALDTIDLSSARDEALSLAFDPDGHSFVAGTARGIVLRFRID
jgi:WD40 repeat protein